MALLLACTPVKRDADPSSADGFLAPGGGSGSAQPCLAEQYPIVFTSTRGDSINGLELYVMSFDGAVKQIGFRPRFIAPRWSPDGRAVAFRHQVAEVLGATIASEVQLIAPDGNERVSLTAPEIMPVNDHSVLPIDAPSWSPDGTTLAYAKTDGANASVWLVPREGGEPRRLLPELEAAHHSPSWSDGASIALVVERSGVEDIWRVDADAPAWPGIALTAGQVQMPRSLRWSPDGRRIAFSALDPSPGTGGDFEIFLLDVATGTLTQLTHDDATDLHPVWSPDGNELLITRGASLADAGALPLDTQRLELWRLPLSDPESAEPITFDGWMNCAADWFAGGCGPP